MEDRIIGIYFKTNKATISDNSDYTATVHTQRGDFLCFKGSQIYEQITSDTNNEIDVFIYVLRIPQAFRFMGMVNTNNFINDLFIESLNPEQIRRFVDMPFGLNSLTAGKKIFGGGCNPNLLTRKNKDGKNQVIHFVASLNYAPDNSIEDFYYIPMPKPEGSSIYYRIRGKHKQALTELNEFINNPSAASSINWKNTNNLSGDPKEIVLGYDNVLRDPYGREFDFTTQLRLINIMKDPNVATNELRSEATIRFFKKSPNPLEFGEPALATPDPDME